MWGIGYFQNLKSFMRTFLKSFGGSFLEEFFLEEFFGGIFWRIFFEDILGGFLWEDFLGGCHRSRC